MYLDHQPMWDGQMFSCLCGAEFVLKSQTPIQEGWEKEFDERFPQGNQPQTFFISTFRLAVKEFLRETIASSEQRTKDEMTDYIDGEVLKVEGEEVHKLELAEILKEARNLPTKLK